MKKYFFLISSEAGGGKPLRYVQEIQDVFASLGMEDQLELRLTEHERHAEELAGAFGAIHGKNGIVYSCGGDGTLGEVAGALLGTKCTLGVIPLGTGNDFSKTAYPTRNISEILRASIDPVIRPIDVIELLFENGEKRRAVCVNVVSYGFDTLVLRQATAIQKRLPFVGGLSYLLGVFPVLFRDKSFTTRITFERVDGTVESFESDNILVAICNGKYYGGGFYPAPMAKIDDGVLNMFLAETMPTSQMIPLIFQYKKGTHIHNPKVRLEEVVSGSVERITQPIMGNHDGTLYESDKLSFRVLPRALPFAFPRL